MQIQTFWFNFYDNCSVHHRYYKRRNVCNMKSSILLSKSNLFLFLNSSLKPSAEIPFQSTGFQFRHYWCRRKWGKLWIVFLNGKNKEKPFITNGDLGSISLTFYMQLLRQQSCASKVQTLNVSTKKLCAKLTYAKAAHRKLEKLTPWSQSLQTFFFIKKIFFSIFCY